MDRLGGLSFKLFKNYDHVLACVTIKLVKAEVRMSVYWKFKASLLDEKDAQDLISVITRTSLRTLPDMGMMVRVFTNDPGDLGSVPGRVIPKTQKMVLHASLLNTQYYKVRINGSVFHYHPGKRVASSPTPWCCSYQKGSLQITLDKGCQLYFL